MALVSLITFSTVGYSAYADVSNVLNTVGGSSSTSAITTKAVVQGSTEVVYLNVTLANGGLYPVDLSLACLPSDGNGIACTSPSASVLPGQSQTLHFVMTIDNYTQALAGAPRIDGQLEVTLVPFASINLTVDLGSLITRGA